MNQPLFVAAVPGEVTQLPEGTTLLITGIGTLAAAISLTEYLANARAAGQLPSRIINVGTAGALRPELGDGVYEINSVFKHDFDSDVVPGVAERFSPDVIEPTTSGLFPVASLATGDTFVNDSAKKEALASRAGLVDMEGYAIAAVGLHFGVPVTLLKQISDHADEATASGWADSLDECSRKIAEAVAKLNF